MEETSLWLKERKRNLITGTDIFTYKIEAMYLHSFYELYRNIELFQLLKN